MNIQQIYKPLKYSMLFVLALIISTGCDSFLDVNDDPNSTTEAPGDLLFAQAAAVLQSNRNIEVGPDMAFFAQTYASNGSAGVFLGPDRYAIGPSDFSVTNNFGGIYTNVQNNLQLFINDAQNAANVRDNAIAQARILQTYTFYYLTVLFGDVPFNEALDPDIANPVFDEQQAIFSGVIERLDASIAMIDVDNQSNAIQEEDLFYGGNMQQWLQFANSLKLRVLMLQFNTDESVASDIQALIDNENLIRTNIDNLQFPYATAAGNENQQFQVHADFAGGNPAFFFGSETIIGEMLERDDPRLSTYFLPNTQGNFVGARNGAIAQDASLVGPNFIRPAFPGRILTASEVLFHEAEFLAIQGQTAEALTRLETGIRSSIDFFDGIPGEISEEDEDAYVTSILANFTAASNDEQVRIIQVQHFIDVFEKSPENWTLYRRTKVPAVDLPVSAQLGTIIRRFPISQEEVSANTNAPETQVPLDTPMSFETEDPVFDDDGAN